MRFILGGDSKLVAILLVLVSLGVCFPNDGARARNNFKTADKVSLDLSQRGRERQRGAQDEATSERISIPVSLGPNILTNLGAGLGCAYFLDTNMLIAEGIMIGHGIMLSNGIMIGDLLLQAQISMTSTDKTPFMR